jgi:hypothetical protein
MSSTRSVLLLLALGRRLLLRRHLRRLERGLLLARRVRGLGGLGAHCVLVLGGGRQRGAAVSTTKKGVCRCEGKVVGWWAHLYGSEAYFCPQPM